MAPPFTEEEIMALKGKVTQQSQSLPRKLIPNPMLVLLPKWTTKQLHLSSLSISTIFPDFFGIFSNFYLNNLLKFAHWWCM